MLVVLPHPHAVPELAGAAEGRLVLLLEALLVHGAFALALLLLEVAKELEDGVSNAERCLVNVLFAYVFSVHVHTLKLELSRRRMLLAVNTIKLVRNNPNKNLVLQQNAI